MLTHRTRARGKENRNRHSNAVLASSAMPGGSAAQILCSDVFIASAKTWQECRFFAQQVQHFRRRGFFVRMSDSVARCSGMFCGKVLKCLEDTAFLDMLTFCDGINICTTSSTHLIIRGTCNVGSKRISKQRLMA